MGQLRGGHCEPFGGAHRSTQRLSTGGPEQLSKGERSDEAFVKDKVKNNLPPIVRAQLRGGLCREARGLGKRSE